MLVNRMRYILKTSIMIFVIHLLMSSCIKEYWPDLKDGSDNLLVVDGKITNEKPPYTIQLSRTSSLQNPEFIPETGADVYIVDITGMQEYCQEISEGIYQTSGNGMQGIVGNKYKLFVQTKSGSVYESEFEELLAPVGVNSVTYAEETHYVENTGNQQQKGYQFYITTDVAPADDNYYYWELEETYEYHSAYNIIFYYNGFYVPPDAAHPLGLPRTINEDTLYYCWKTALVKERFSYSTEYLNTPVIENLPLHFIPFGDERLQQKYSLLVKQQRISSEAYNFMKALEEQNSDQGGLITSQPFQVRGNMRCKSNQEETTLGYFMAAGVSDAERIFVKAPYYYHLQCGADTSTYNIKRYIEISKPDIWPLYFTYVYFPNPDPMGEAIEALALVHQDCLDCTKRGGVAVKPDFWQ